MLLRNIFNAILKQIPRGAEEPGLKDQGPEIHFTASTLRQLNRMHLNASRLLPGYQIGMRPSLRRKPSSDFHQHRMYVPGDDVRFVDWKASGRQEHIFIKQGEHPKEATIYVLLDCSSSMAWGKPPKAIAALNLAAALGYMALAHADRFVLVPFSAGAAQYLGPISGKGQFPNLVNFLYGLKFAGETDLTRSIREFTRRAGTKTGLALIVSDLLSSTGLEEALSFLPAPSWDVIVLHVLHPEELHPILRGDYEIKDTETGLKENHDINPKALAAYQEYLQAWKKRLELNCIEANAFYTSITSNWSLDTEILPHLRDVNVVKPL